MYEIDRIIDTDNKLICKNIEKFEYSERGLLAQNIITNLRHFVEHISLKAYSQGKDIEVNYDNIKLANKYVSITGKLSFLNKFYKFLQPVVSHYIPTEDGAERLMLKYKEYLIRIKQYLKYTFDIEVLENIENFPINHNSSMLEYYEKIAGKIENPKKTTHNGKFYIQKKKPFFVGGKIYYEITFTRANDRTSKFDRIIAFTNIDISEYYAVKLFLYEDNIKILDKYTPINIIDKYEVSIRPCEFDNFAKFFGNFPKVNSSNLEYRELMSFLTSSGINLNDFLLNDEYYQKVKNYIINKSKSVNVFNILDKTKDLLFSGKPGSNVIRYLLYKLNNKIIKQQYHYEECSKLSNLFLKWGCIPFDQMPFDTALIGHNPRAQYLYDCIDMNDREHELFAKFIKNNTENGGLLYTHVDDISGFENPNELIKIYNSKLYKTHTHRKLEIYKDYIYIKGYEEDTINIIKILKQLSLTGVKNYSNSFNSWLKKDIYGMNIDCEEKINYLKIMFESSHVAMIYGSAGTGKSTIINHLSNFYRENTKLYIANTHPAVENLKRKNTSPNCRFMTISTFLSNRNLDTEFDILFIDECSTVSNLDMLNILKKAKFNLLVLVGDIYQIESIIFGNWFNISRNFITNTSIFELIKPYRSSNHNLIELWSKVRNINDNILECITRNNYSAVLNESIFDYSDNDEIILCLNYDGLYGINNINRFLQINNKNKSFRWGINIYKIGDPILFNEAVNDSGRFGPALYNNLKGKIVNIILHDKKIQFFIEIDNTIDEIMVSYYDLELEGNSENGKSIISFYVDEYETANDDNDTILYNNIVPFQIAYAVSIHKAQGLEYNSVKIVITDEIEEMITHNIFYTSITRAKEKLKIYRTPETEEKVLKKLEVKNIKRDIGLILSKYTFD